MCPCAAVRRVGRGDDSGLLPGVDGWEQRRNGPFGMEKSFPPNGPACLSRASHQRCGPAASRIARPRCVRGSSRRKPAGRYPEVLPRMGLPAPFPGGGGHAHPCTPQFVPSRIGHAPSAELRSAAILDRELDTRPRVRSVSVLSGLHVGEGRHLWMCPPVATAYTAFSEVLVGFAWGTESHSGQRNTSALAAPGLPGSGRRGLLPTPGDLGPLSHATRRCRPAGAGHDNGQT